METFEDFQRRHHCAHTSPDEIERYYYDALVQIEQLTTALDKISMIPHSKEYDHIRMSKWESTLRDAVDIARKALQTKDRVLFENCEVTHCADPEKYGVIVTDKDND